MLLRLNKWKSSIKFTVCQNLSKISKGWGQRLKARGGQKIARGGTVAPPCLPPPIQTTALTVIQ